MEFYILSCHEALTCYDSGKALVATNDPGDLVTSPRCPVVQLGPGDLRLISDNDGGHTGEDLPDSLAPGDSITVGISNKEGENKYFLLRSGERIVHIHVVKY